MKGFIKTKGYEVQEIADKQDMSGISFESDWLRRWPIMQQIGVQPKQPYFTFGTQLEIASNM